MKITFVTMGWTLSGGDRVIAIYADRLRKRGHDVLLIARDMIVPSFMEQVKSVIKGKGLIKFDRAEEERQTHLPADVPRKRMFGKARVEDADVREADVVIATWWETAEWVATFAPSKGAKVFFIQHYEVFGYLPKERVDATWRLPFHKITISKWLIDLARDTFGDGKASLVFNSVDTDQFHAPPRGKNAVPTIGFLYGDTRWKGTDVCLDAIKRLPFPVKVVSFGSSVKDPMTTELPLPAGSTYHYQPRQDFIREIYASCDVWLCGSRGEGFHLPPLEAMACRCPVVSTAVGGPIDIIKDGVNGYVVPIEDSAALAKRLEQVLSAPEPEWKQLSDGAYATAVGFTWDDATALFEKGLELAIERRNRGETT